MQDLQSMRFYPQADNQELQLDKFQTWLESCAVASNTCRVYLSRMRNFEKYMQQALVAQPFASLEECVLNYIIDCRRSAESSSVRAFCVAFKSYCRFRKIPEPQIKIEVREKLVRLLSPEQQQRILQILNDNHCNKERAMISMILLAGLRTGEIVRTNINDIYFERGVLMLSIRNERGLVDRILPISSVARRMITAWLIERKGLQTTDQALFVSASGERLHPNTIRWCVGKLGQQLRIVLTPQILRNTFIANLAGKLDDFGTVASLAGLQATERVARFVRSKNVVDKLTAVELAAADACIDSRSDGTGLL